MSTEQILKVLKNERDCIKNNHDYCYEDCDESCPYYVSEKDKLEVYDHLIRLVETDKLVLDIGYTDEERKEKLQRLYDAGFSLHPALIEKYGIEVKGDTD